METKKQLPDVFEMIVGAIRPQQREPISEEMLKMIHDQERRNLDPLDFFTSAEANLPDPTPAQNAEKEMEQRTFEWFLNRIDKFTGSKIPDLMKQGRAKGEEWGETAKGVILEMATLQTMTEEGRAEYIYQQMKKDFVQTRHGNENEPIARQAYCELTGYVVDVTGFTVNPRCPYHGGSFDGEVKELGASFVRRGIENGIIEIKCPFDPVKHIQNLNLMRTGLDVKHEYYGQIQSNIETAGAAWCDFVSFDPRQDESHRLVVIRVYRDEIYIEAMMDRIHQAKRILDLYLDGESMEEAIFNSKQ